MYVKVRTMDGKQSAVLTVSKMMKVMELRKLVEEKLQVEPEKQRLFFRGKQLEDEYQLVDYGINVNDVIQLLIRNSPLAETIPSSAENVKCEKPKQVEPDCATSSPAPKAEVSSKKSKDDLEDATSSYYEVGDLVDAKDPFTSSWIEAKIVKITQPPAGTPQDQNIPESFKFHVLFQGHLLEDPTLRNLTQVRPRASKILPFDSLSIGDMVMVNYNLEDRKERGPWYDAKITGLTVASRTSKKVIVTVVMGENNDTEVADCDVYFVKEIFQIPPLVKIADRTEEEKKLLKEGPATARTSIPYCQRCNDNPRRKCKFCGCHECGSKDNPNQQVMCDECDIPYHIYCLKPPLEAVPESEEWYCPNCKTDDSKIVKAGEKLKESKKNAKRPSNVTTSTRDWGRGMACAGRAKECTIVPSNHFGPIPGVDVGTMWRYRFQASEAGVHRPPVGGIHGREKEGAYSIVLSGGYEDDEDFGDSFYYTGSGGRDLTGNKRTAEQSCDQTLTRMNMALALNCAAPLNAQEGGEAKDWRKGKPVRVLRKGHGDEKTGKVKHGKHNNKYSPEIGVRYDGIYKVVKYWPEKGKSGFIVWRYFLMRDDPVPPVWTPDGRKKVEQLGLDQVIYPEGHLEAQEAQAQEKASGKAGKKTLKDFLTDNQSGSPPKKVKKAGYQLETETENLIEADELNAKSWEECKEELGDTKQKFLSKVEDRFLCICCQDLVCRPITTPCKHNICQSCLSRAFKAGVYTCPSCRFDLGKNYSVAVNDKLAKALNSLFPGYEGGR